jgi:hypothetical protein
MAQPGPSVGAGCRSANSRIPDGPGFDGPKVGSSPHCRPDLNRSRMHAPDPLRTFGVLKAMVIASARQSVGAFTGFRSRRGHPIGMGESWLDCRRCQPQAEGRERKWGGREQMGGRYDSFSTYVGQTPPR